MKRVIKRNSNAVKVSVKKAMKGKAVPGDRATRNVDGRQRGTSMAGMHCASIADGTGRRRASTFSRSRDTRTARSLNANWLPRDARSVVSLNAHRPENVEAQLPLPHSQARVEEVAGSLPLTVRLSAGPYDTSRSLTMRSHESLSGLLHLHPVAILIPPATLPSRGSLLGPLAVLVATLRDLPSSRFSRPLIETTRRRSAQHVPSPHPLPSEGDSCCSHAHTPVVRVIVPHPGHRITSRGQTGQPSSVIIVPHPGGR